MSVTEEIKNLKLGDITSLSQGLAINSKTKHLLKNKGIPLLRIKDLINNQVEQYVDTENAPRKCLARKSDIIYTRTGQVGLVFNDREGVIHNNCFKVIPDETIVNKKFLYWFLFQKKVRDYAINIASGSVQKDLNHSSFASIPIKLPSLKHQEKAAKIFDTLKRKIELNLKMNETLEEIAKRLFKSWFIDFDPVRAKAEGRPTGLSKEISDLFPDSFEDSELGEIPTGWKVSKLESIFDVLGGHAFKSKDYVDNGVFVLRTKNFNKGIAEPLHDDVFLPKSFLDSHQDFICEEYDYHLVMVGASLGKTGMIFPSMMPALRNQNMWCFRPREAKFSKLFTKFVVDTVTKKLLGFASGSARDFFKKGDFRSHKLVIPPETILESFRSITDPLLTKKSKNIEETKLITNLRDILLPKLISGELQIPDAENLIEEADI